MRVAGRSLVLAALALVGGGLLRAEDVDGGVREELRGIRQTLAQLLGVLEELQRETARRNALSVLQERIATAERRLLPLERQAEALRQRRQEAEAEAGKLESGLLGLQEMEKADTSGSAAAAFEAERRRLNGEAQQKRDAAAQIGQQLAQLEKELAERRQAVEGLDARLERLWGERGKVLSEGGSDAN